MRRWRLRRMRLCSCEGAIFLRSFCMHAIVVSYVHSVLFAWKPGHEHYAFGTETATGIRRTNAWFSREHSSIGFFCTCLLILSAACASHKLNYFLFSVPVEDAMAKGLHFLRICTLDIPHTISPIISSASRAKGSQIYCR